MKIETSWSTVAVAIVVAVGVGCAERPRDMVVEREGEPDVHQVAADDPEMNAAIAEAQRTLEDFAERLRAPRPGQESFSVKVRLEEGDNIEHMWLSEPTVGDSAVEGRLDNEPLGISAYALGDTVSVPRDRVSDWMYIDNGVLRGGYSIRLLRDRMPPEQRLAFDQQVGFAFE